jgi:AraC-like DNA-binding protein
VDLSDVFEYYHVPPLKPSLRLMTISFDELENLLMSENFDAAYSPDGSVAHIINKAAFAGTEVLTEILREIMGDAYSLTHVLIDSYMCVIISGSPHTKEEAADCFSRFRAAVSERYGFGMPIGVSGCAEKPDDLPRLYLQCAEVMEYIQLLGLRDTVLYDDITGGSFQLTDWFDNAEEQIKKHVQSSEFKQAKALIVEFFDKMSGNPASLQILQCRFFGVINSMLTVFGSLSENGKSEMVVRLKPAERFFTCQNTSAMKETLINMLDEVEEMLKKDIHEKHESLLAAIYKEIDGQYLDPDLSVGRISSNLGMNFAYLSKFFKVETGMGMLEYIHRKRIELAKTMLKDNKYSVLEAGNNSGFNNNLTFIRVFKKYENMTPGQYKLKQSERID